MYKIIPVLIGLFLIGCNPSSEMDMVKEINPTIEVNRPLNFPEMTYDLKNNPPTKYGVELGRRLFYEGKLSADNSTACAFCHIQENAFTHHGHALSHGVFNRTGIRNTPPIQNMAFMYAIMWDGVFANLDQQPIAPITAHEEMGETFENIIKKLNETKDYPELFYKAFGSSQIRADLLVKALSQFMITMVSANSKYDQVVRNEGASFTSDEKAGKLLFDNYCASCHATDLFTDQSFRNNGLSYNPTLEDYGRYRVTDNEQDKMKFRVPSLRNIELTAPYMHDGRFATLETVLNHYTKEVTNWPNLDPLLKQNETLGISLTKEEQKQLIAFLKTLTDYSFISNKNFSEFPNL